MAEDDLIGETIGGSGFEDQVAKFMRTEKFAALLDGALSSSPAVVSPSAASGVVPVGTIVAFGGQSSPSDWLLCNGSSFDQNQYPDLFRALGGSTTPDLRGRSIVGVGTGEDLTARTLLQYGGHEELQAHDHGGYTGYDNPRHSHTMPAGGEHVHGLGVRFGSDGDPSVRNGVREANAAIDSAAGVRTAGSAHSHAINEQDINHRHTIASAGGGNAGNMPPFVVLNYIIKAR